jgi:PAS domain S-box-containing protein
VRALRFGIAAIAAIAAAVIAIALVATSGHEEHPWLTGLLAVPAALSFVCAGLVALWRRPENATGFLLAATGYLWFLGALGESGSAWVWTIGFVVGNFAFIAFVALILAYPDGKLTRFERSLVIAAGITVVSANLLIALVDESPAASCSDCPGSAIAVRDWPGLARALGLAATLFAVGVLVVVGVRLVAHWREATETQRRTLLPVFVASGLAIALLVLTVVTDAVGHTVNSVVWLLFLASFAAVPLTFLAGVLRTQLDRAAVAGLLRALDAGQPIRDALAAALRDPSLEVVYWIEEDDRWISSDGQTLQEPEPSATRSVTMVERNGVRIAAVVHDPALDREPEIVKSVAAAAGFQLDNTRLQADLRAQYGVLETIADTVPSLLVTIDTDGRIRNQNRAALELTCCRADEEVRGRFFWDVFIDANERDAVRERFAELAPDFPPRSYENTFTNARGEVRVIAWESAPVVDDNGAVVRIVAGGIDITERQRREHELQRERDITDTVLHAIPSLTVVVDDDGVIVDRDDESPDWAAVNTAFRDLLGWPDAAIVHRPFHETIVGADDATAAAAAIASAARGIPSPPLESVWRTADGDDKVIAWTAMQIADVTDRRPSLVFITGNDVTERRRQEDEIRASRARIIGATDEARRRLERNLHDGAQQRLVSLSLSLRLAEAKLGSDPAGAASIITAAREELGYAIDELRELARGIHPAILTDCGLAAAVGTLADRSPLPVEIDVRVDRLPAPIEAALYYVVSESLANVAKHAQATAARVVIDETDGIVTAEISDDGVGGADPTAGSGIGGLADRVAVLDGRLAVTSHAGEGTTVRAELPVASGVPAA